jgi:hypothetical protein
MTFQDTLTIAIILTIVIAAFLFSDGGPGTPKRIKVPIPRPNTSW